MNSDDKFTITATDFGWYVYCKGTGLRNSSADLLVSTKTFLDVVERITTTKLIIADYSQVVTIASNVDLFNMVCMCYARKEMLDKFFIAFVVRNEEIEIANYFEELCSKKAFQFKVFPSIDLAERWLTAL